MGLLWRNSHRNYYSKPPSISLKNTKSEHAGSVYYATLDDGRQVAIKRAETSVSSSYVGGCTKRQQDHAFVNELESLSRLNHENSVRLLGFFEDAKERILVYEHMNNGPLHDHLHKLPHSPLLSWAKHIKVALDAARGIEYLHEQAVPPIIHRYIKSSNILLHDTLRVKVSVFGLSLMGPEDEELDLLLVAAGTFGYIDPEYYMKGYHIVNSFYNCNFWL